MASDNDITVRKRRCKDVFDGDLAHYIPGSSDDALTYSKKAEWWAVKWPDAAGDGKVDDLDYSSKKWAVYTDGPVDTANNLFSSKLYALNAEEQAGISLTWANKSQEWAESDTVIEGTETSYSSKHWAGISKEWSDDALSYSIAADNSRQLAFEWAEKMNGPVAGDQYSAKYWAGKAEERSGGSEQWSIISHNWANGGLAEGAVEPSITDTNSSLYWAYQSALSAAAADQYQQLAYSYQEESKRLKLDAVTARTGAETALVKAETALRLAETALTAAETAQTAAETAQGKAEDALEAAETALAAAESALTAAETAQTKSEQAQDAAETALTAAEVAQGKAESAQNAAETALTAAEVAQGKAEDAQTAAETAQRKSEEALTAAETALTAAETALDITETARDRAQEWAESDQGITVPGDTDTHYSAKKHAQDALDTFGLTANVYTLTVGVYNDTTIASAAAHGHADDAMRANESAQEAKGDAIAAQTAAETALVAAEAARDLAQEWADNDEDVPVGDTDDKYSAKHWATKAENTVASLGNVAMRDAANVFQSDNQFNGNVSIGLPGTPGDKAKCQLNRTSTGYNASGALIDNLGRYMLITNNGAGNKTNFITYINNHSSDLDITASSADGNYIYLEAKVAGTYANEIEYYAVGSFYDNSHGSTTLGTTTTGTDEVKAQCKTPDLTSYLASAGSIVYTKGGVVKGIGVAPDPDGSRTRQDLAELINANGNLDFTAEVSGSTLLLTNKEFGADSTTYYRTGCFNNATHLKVKQGTVTPGTEDIPGSDNTLTINGASVPTHFGNNEYVGINIFTGPVGIQSTGSFTNNGVTVMNGEVVSNLASVLKGGLQIGNYKTNYEFFTRVMQPLVYKEIENSTLTIDQWLKLVYLLDGDMPYDIPEPPAIKNATKGFFTANGHGVSVGNPRITKLPNSWLWENLKGVDYHGWSVSPFAGMISLKELPANMTLSNFTANGDSYVSGGGPGASSWKGLFKGCLSLEKLPDGMLFNQLTDGQAMFTYCYSLSSLPAGMTLSNLTQAGPTDSLYSAKGMFANCSSLHDLPDTLNLSSLSNGAGMFYSCTLNPESVVRVLTTIPEYTDGTHRLHIGYKTNWAESQDIADILDTTTPIVAGTYSVKGWTVYVQ